MGVYSADTLPQKIQFYPSCYIVNTDESTDAGEHSVCIYFNSNQDAECFCSFANTPFFYDKHILSFIERNCCSWICNVKRLQSSVSTVCGQYCIFFAVCKSINVDLKQICSVFCSHYLLYIPLRQLSFLQTVSFHMMWVRLQGRCMGAEA